MSSVKEFKIDFFTRIDEVVHSQTAKEARDKAYEIASAAVYGEIKIPNEKEFEDIIKPKEE